MTRKYVTWLNLVLGSCIVVVMFIVYPDKAVAQVDEKQLVRYIIDCWAAYDDFDDCIKPHIDLESNEIGFRIGSPILSAVTRNQPEVWQTNTKYNTRKLYNFRLLSITDAELNIGYSFSWDNFTDNPAEICAFGGCVRAGPETIKVFGVNCDGIAFVKLGVSSDHRIITQPPILSGPNCNSDGGFEIADVLEYMMQGLTGLVSGGEDVIGLFDILAGLGVITYDFVAIFTQENIELTGPIRAEILNSNIFQYLDRIYELDEDENEVVLSDIRYDPKGVWIILEYPQQIEELVCEIASLVDQTVCANESITLGQSSERAETTTENVGNLDGARTGATDSSSVTVTANTLNVRSGPSTSYQVVTQVKNGQSLVVIDDQSNAGWMQVDVATTTGWVSKRYVTYNDSGTPTKLSDSQSAQSTQTTQTTQTTQPIQPTQQTQLNPPTQNTSVQPSNVQLVISHSNKCIRTIDGQTETLPIQLEQATCTSDYRFTLAPISGRPDYYRVEYTHRNGAKGCFTVPDVVREPFGNGAVWLRPCGDFDRFLWKAESIGGNLYTLKPFVAEDFCLGTENYENWYGRLKSARFEDKRLLTVNYCANDPWQHVIIRR
ncbi:MAG: SH3 domain-containing protein [Chloroflexota bacterium]